jgi:hypothetical protein
MTDNYLTWPAGVSCNTRAGGLHDYLTTNDNAAACWAMPRARGDPTLGENNEDVGILGIWWHCG